MPTRVHTLTQSLRDAKGNVYATYTSSVENSSWGVSSRVNGKLQLRAQACSMVRCMCPSWYVDGSSAANPVAASTSPPRPDDESSSFASLDNQAYARFMGKLRKGSASMGVTAASWRQSRDMVVARSNHVQRTLDSTIARLSGNKRARERMRREREPLANQVLETKFGWEPLISDIHAALFTVCSGLDGVEYITSRARGRISSEKSYPGNAFDTFYTWDGLRWVTYNARVAVSNPNMWLLNRMGLVNPATVAWDLVPWSFVVSMFVNVNQIVGSITDEVGLSITDRNVTRGQSFQLTNSIKPKPGFERSYRPGRSELLFRSRSRTLNAAPPVTWELKVPKLDWSLAVTATALVVQRFKTINNLIRAV